MEQVNCISSPSIRQALSSRHTNLGGAKEEKNRSIEEVILRAVSAGVIIS